MAAVIGQVRDLITRPFGVDLVWDPVSSLAVARATGASFVREVFTGVFESDLGMMQPDFGAIAAYREQIGAGAVAMFSNITPEFASSLGNRSIADASAGARRTSASTRSSSAGRSPARRHTRRELLEAKEAVPDMPVLANTGVREETVDEILAIADGVFVGTSLKRDGVTWNPVDPRARRTVHERRAPRARGGSRLTWQKRGSTSSATCTDRACASASSSTPRRSTRRR